MVLQANGTISVGDVNAEFEEGNSISLYRGLRHQDFDDMFIKNFSTTGPFRFSEFYNTADTPENAHVPPEITFTLNTPTTFTTFSNSGDIILSFDFTVDYGAPAEFRPPIEEEITEIEWQESIDGGNTWIVVAGETSKTLIVSNDIGNDGYRYRAQVFSYKTAAQDLAPYDSGNLGPVVTVVSTTEFTNETELDISIAPAITPNISVITNQVTPAIVSVTRYFQRDGTTPSGTPTLSDPWNLDFTFDLQSLGLDDAPGRFPLQTSLVRLEESNAGPSGPWTVLSGGDQGDGSSIGGATLSQDSDGNFLANVNARWTNIPDDGRNGNYYRLYAETTVNYSNPTANTMATANSEPILLTIDQVDKVAENIPPTGILISNIRTTENTAVDIFPINFNTDGDGDTMTLSNAGFDNFSMGQGHSIEVNGVPGRIRVTPDTGFTGTIGVIYQLFDGFDLGPIGQIGILVEAAPPPTPDSVARNDAFTVAYQSSNNTLDVLANDTNNAGFGTLTIISATVRPGSGGSVSIQGGSTLRYNAPSGTSGTMLIDYTMRDPLFRQYSATATVTVSAPAPLKGSFISLVASPQTVNQGSSVTLTLTTTNAVGKKFDAEISGTYVNEYFGSALTFSNRTIGSDGKATFGWSSNDYREFTNDPTFTVTVTPVTASQWNQSSIDETFTIQDGDEVIDMVAITDRPDEGNNVVFRLTGFNVNPTSVPWSINLLSAPGDVAATSGSVNMVWNGARYQADISVGTTDDAASTSDKAGSMVVSRSEENALPFWVINTDVPAITVSPIVVSRSESVSTTWQLLSRTFTVNLNNNGTLSTGGTWATGSDIDQYDIEITSQRIVNSTHTGGGTTIGVVTGRLTLTATYENLISVTNNPPLNFTNGDIGLITNQTGAIRIVGNYRARHRSSGITSNISTFDMTLTVTPTGTLQAYGSTTSGDNFVVTPTVTVPEPEVETILWAPEVEPEPPVVTRIVRAAATNNDAEYEAYLNQGLAAGWYTNRYLTAASFTRNGYVNWSMVSAKFGAEWVRYLNANPNNTLRYSPSITELLFG